MIYLVGVPIWDTETRLSLENHSYISQIADNTKNYVLNCQEEKLVRQRFEIFYTNFLLFEIALQLYNNFTTQLCSHEYIEVWFTAYIRYEVDSI